jgi:hypothetical protein
MFNGGTRKKTGAHEHDHPHGHGRTLNAVEGVLEDHFHESGVSMDSQI